MTETEFGGGGYVYTFAETPSPPHLEIVSATTIRLTIGPDDNPPQTLYAILNTTDENYINSDGSVSDSAKWQHRGEWGTTEITALNPSTVYLFCIIAMNTAGIESDLGQSSSIRTLDQSTLDLELSFTVKKSSSTITAPDFMSNTRTGVRIAGKELQELGFVTDKITGLDALQVEGNEELIPGGHSWNSWEEYFTLKRITIEGYLHGVSSSDLQIRLAYLKSFLTTFAGNPWRPVSPVRLESNNTPDRHWNTYYERLDFIEPLGKYFAASSYRLSIRMKCLEPFSIANEVTRLSLSPDNKTFIPLELGNAPSETVFSFTGPSINPTISLGDMMFHCDFSNGLMYCNMRNDPLFGQYTPVVNEAAAYRITNTGTGLYVDDTNTISFPCTGNPSDCSWVVVIVPHWQSSHKEEDAVIIEHWGDNNNFIRLYWDAESSVWIFQKRSAGTDHTVTSSQQYFTAESLIILGISFDSTNAGGMKLFINGNVAGINTDCTPLDLPPETLTLHASNGTQQPDTVYDMLAGWSRMLSADEMLKICSDPTAVKNLNTTLSYAGTLDEGDILTMDSSTKTADLFDISEGTHTNVLHSVTGDIPSLTPGRKRTATDRTQTVLFTESSAGKLDIRYTRRYL